MILTRAELRELTSRKSRRHICAELDALGIRYGVGIDGWPRVLRQHMIEVLSGRKEQRKRLPNFEALEA